MIMDLRTERVIDLTGTTDGTLYDA
jgi:hypothetical protein